MKREGRFLKLKFCDRSIAITGEPDENSTSPASIMLNDPDGNPILLDQMDPNYTPAS